MSCPKLVRLSCLLALCSGLLLLGATPAWAQCSAGPAPQCGGPCPPGNGCGVNPAPLGCLCDPPSGPCSECPPGPHFVHAPACGPLPDSDLVANHAVLAGVDFDFDCQVDLNLVMGPCPTPEELLRVDRQILGDDSSRFPGTRPIDGHQDVIDTEIISMCLTGSGAALVAGRGGPSTFPLRPSFGVVAETPSDPALADSFFDVFVELQPPGGPACYNLNPSKVVSQVNCLPPSAVYQKVTACLPFFTRGQCVGGLSHGQPCVYPENCPGGSCQGQQHIVNLVTALHEVNTRCDQTAPPACNATCPNTTDICRPDDTGTACSCQAQVPPCDQTFPACDGPCPPGQICLTDPLGECVCGPPPPPCDMTSPPQCGGTCPPGEVCIGINAADPCTCVKPCQQTFPACDGPCPPPQICVNPPGTTECVCVDPQPPCDQSAPACNGLCPNPADICVPDATGTGCFCEPPPCDQTFPPACNGTCPNPAEVCVPGPAGAPCHCEPPPCDHSAPACNGACPNPADMCVDNGVDPPGCHCEPPPCDQTAPACNGACPNPADMCVDNGVDPPGCHCQPPPTPCAQSLPQCGGFCPAFQACFASIPPVLGCVCCPVGIPTDLVTGVLFTSKVKIIWDPVPNPCPYTYNIYQKTAPVMPDSDNDGVADDYGTCLDFGLTSPEYVDTSPDPPPDWTHFYQITVENQLGQEGSMGFASNLLPRPNVFPCP